jgi:uncharacterized protein (TIGR03382 family)
MFFFALFNMTAAAFTITQAESGGDIQWRSFPIPYAIDLHGAPDALDDAQWMDVIAASFDTWTDIPDTKLSFRETDLELDSDSLKNLVWFESSWQDDPDTGAIASMWVEDNTLVGFDIRINADTIAWSIDGSATDAQAAITHEIGHAIGVGHSNVEAATMYFEILGDDTLQRSLEPDDVRAVTHLYSHRVLGVPEFLSCNTASSTSRSPWAAVGLLALFRRRRHTETRP